MYDSLMAEVTARLKAGTKVDLHTRHLSWTADEPPLVGGTDTGPTPYELLLGSLAACVAITLRLYANHKAIRLSTVDVVLELDRVHADDCEECDERHDGWIDRVQTRVALHGVFSDAEKKRLEQVASRCPVHKTLASGMQIVDSVTFQST